MQSELILLQKKKKENLTLFSNHNRSLLRRQSRVILLYVRRWCSGPCAIMLAGVRVMHCIMDHKLVYCLAHALVVAVVPSLEGSIAEL